MALHLHSEAAVLACLNSILAGILIVIVAVVMFLCDPEEKLPAGYMLFNLAASSALFCPENEPVRLRRTASLIVLVAGVSVAVLLGAVTCVVVGRIHWSELVLFVPPLLVAVGVLRVACPRLRSRMAELEQNYTLDGHERRSACPVCVLRDEPKARHELWEPFYDARYGVYRAGIAYSYALKKYECGFASGGRCADGPFEQPHDLAEHMLNGHWDDRFRCPGFLRSLRRVRCGGGWGG